MSCFCGTPFTRVSASRLVNVRRIYGKTPPVTAAGVHALRDEYTRAIQPSRARAAKTFNLERTLSDLVNQAYAHPEAAVLNIESLIIGLVCIRKRILFCAFLLFEE
jgi:hypothetical protein